MRARDRKIDYLRAELEQTQLMNNALENEFRAAPLPHPPDFSGRPGAPMLLGPLKEIEIGRGTGGIDEDGLPGDEALLVVLIPRDSDGSEVKAPGSLLVTAYEITDQGLKLPLSQWEVTSLELRRRWKSGLFSTGYHVRLEWQRFPSVPRLRLVVQLTMLDGQVYEADRDVKVRPMPGSRGPIVVPVEPGLVPVFPEEHPAEPMKSPDQPAVPTEGLPLPRGVSTETLKVRLLPPVRAGG